MSTNVEQFIQLQDTINDQISKYGEADPQLMGELELLGDQLTYDDISIVSNYLAELTEGDMEYEDVEWMDI
jgi:DNA-binding MltR family transcriptional regulator